MQTIWMLASGDRNGQPELMPRKSATTRLTSVCLSFFGILSCLSFQAVPEVRAATVVRNVPVTACGILAEANTTYLLQNDVGSPGTCFTVKAHDITLNLNGHKVTYNTARGDQVYGVLGWWNIPNLRITNGRLTQGAGRGYQSAAVYGMGANNLEVDHLTITYSGDNNIGILDLCGADPGVSIHDNLVYPNGTKRADPKTGYPTHYGGFAAIQVSSCKGTTTITNNVVEGKGMWGISVRTVPPTPTAVEITHNTIEMASPVRNGYAIFISSAWAMEINFEIAYNAIAQLSGRGIMIEGDGPITPYVEGPGFGTIRDNSIDVRESRDAGEYNAPGDSIGIQLRGGVHDVQIYNNTVTEHSGLHACPAQFPTSKGDDCIGNGIKIIGNPYAPNDRVFNNKVTVATADASRTAVGLYGDYIAGPGSMFDHNTVTSNSILIDVNGADGAGSQWLFASNNLIKGPNPLGFAAIRAAYYIDSSLGNTFLDDNWLNGATPDNVIYKGGYGNGEYSYFVKWYLTVIVTDTSAHPLPGAEVTAVTNLSGKLGVCMTCPTPDGESVRQVTDAAGRAHLA